VFVTPESKHNSGTVQSKVDLSEATIVIDRIETYRPDQTSGYEKGVGVWYGFPPTLPHSKLIPGNIQFTLKDNQQVSITDKHLEKINVEGRLVFVYTVQKLPDP
jgi:hypothetical protein